MSVDAIFFVFGLATGFALFGIVLKTVWKRPWRAVDRARSRH